MDDQDRYLTCRPVWHPCPWPAALWHPSVELDATSAHREHTRCYRRCGKSIHAASCSRRRTTIIPRSHDGTTHRQSATIARDAAWQPLTYGGPGADINSTTEAGRRP